MSLQAIHVYRQLLRSSAAAFRNDTFMLQAAQAEIRSKFEVGRLSSVLASRQLDEMEWYAPIMLLLAATLS